MSRVPRTLGAMVAALILAPSWVGCSASSAVPMSPGARPTSVTPAHAARVPIAAAPTAPVLAAPRSADDPIDRVVAISVDGLNPSALTKLGRSGAPTFHRLMREGAWTPNARTAYEQTVTLPNHTGMLTGRRIDRRSGGHGITVNSSPSSLTTGPTVHTAAGRYVSSVFDVVHDRGGRTAMFASKTKFALFARSWNAHGAPDRVGVDNGRAKIDRVMINENEIALVAALVTDLQRTPRAFTFVHLALPDEAGHAYGFGSPRYLAAVRSTDRLLGQVLAAIAARPALKQHTLVAVTADHGGGGSTSHADARAVVNYRIPFFAWGPGVAAGQNLHGLNPSYYSPGLGRPSYAGSQPVRNADLANLVTDVLDLPAVPGSQMNTRQRLSVFPG